MIGIIVFAAISLAVVATIVISTICKIKTDCCTIGEAIGEVMARIVATCIIGVLLFLTFVGFCCSPDYDSTIDCQKKLETIITDIEQGGTISSAEKYDLLDEINDCNDDILYLKEHYNSKWNGALIPDEAKNLKEIPIPEFLKNFN